MITTLEEIPVHRLLEESFAIKSILADRFGITLEARIEDPHVSILGDRRLLGAALNNLIDDAIKHGRRGRKVIVRQRMDMEGLVINVIRLENRECPGTPAGTTALLIEPVPQDTRSGNEGERMGLSLARRIASLHGGWIRIRSKEGEGCVYTLHLPLGRNKGVLQTASRRGMPV